MWRWAPLPKANNSRRSRTLRHALPHAAAHTLRFLHDAVAAVGHEDARQIDAGDTVATFHALFGEEHICSLPGA
jgi:hypothetical protein